MTEPKTSAEQVATQDALWLVNKARDEVRKLGPLEDEMKVRCIKSIAFNIEFDIGSPHKLLDRNLAILAAHCVVWLEQLAREEKP